MEVPEFGPSHLYEEINCKRPRRLVQLQQGLVFTLVHIAIVFLCVPPQACSGNPPIPAELHACDIFMTRFHEMFWCF
jgi:hypothetical protein